MDVDREKLLDEFKIFHQAHGDSEYPFAAVELPCVRAKFGNVSNQVLRQALDQAFHAFNRARKEHLRLYDSVGQTLKTLHNAGMIIVGHTEAMAINACFRLKHLGIASHFRRLYALEGHLGSDYVSRPNELLDDDHFVRLVPKAERKPNPRLILDICEREGVRRDQTWYVGDSLTRDISMAKMAGVCAVWARYGTVYDHDLWDSLVRITHWTEEDVAREARIRKDLESLQPDFVIESFSELLKLLGF